LSLSATFTKTGSWFGVILFGSRVFGLVWSGELGLVKLRLFVRFRKSNGGYYIASVPMNRLLSCLVTASCDGLLKMVGWFWRLSSGAPV
jgi:hypothetical protein